MIHQVRYSSAFLSVLVLSGCAGSLNNETFGQLGGGLAGGLLGSQIGGGSGNTAAIIGGTVLGAFLGGNVGRTMDDVSRRQMAASLNSGRPANWTGANGRQYQMHPGPFNKENHCRSYRMNVVMDGRPQTVHGTACRNSAGHWETR